LWREACQVSVQGLLVHVALGGNEIIARLTRRAADQLRLSPGEPVHVVLKALSVARDHVAQAPTSNKSGR
jgi:molybdate transport system ATP-binding protein